MALDAQPLHVSPSSDVAKLAREVNQTRRARIIQADGEVLAKITPLVTRSRLKHGKRGRPTSEKDTFWNIVGMAHSGEHSDVSAHVDAYLAEWEVSGQR